jgi:CDP-diacylglycerol--glycerol-3-phosphate 3-phosphatidyltransferase
VTLATKITVFRLVLTPILPALLYAYTPEREYLRWAALAFYIAAGVSDGIDGYIARHWKQRSELGARLDPLADKLLVNLGFIFVAANPNFSPGIPLWFPPLLLLRDGGIILGAIFYFKRYGNIASSARPLGKLTTALCMSTFVAALVQFPMTLELLYLCIAAAALSGLDYAVFGRSNLVPPEKAHG